MSRHARRTHPEPLAVRRRRTRARRVLAFGGMLAAVGGLVAARSTVAPAPSSALATSALAAPPSASTPSSPKPSTQKPRSAPERSPHKAAARATSHPTRQAQHTASPAPAAKPKPKPPARREITGQPYDVGYGVVQVRVTLVGSHIQDITALSLPQGGRSSDISSYAAPRLRQEALAAQSARIDTVSGASYTSAGYARSLQSALDASRS